MLDKLLITVKQQEEEGNRFLARSLGVDSRSKKSSSWQFRNPLFVGLNKKDSKAINYCLGIAKSLDRLHSLKHAHERLIESASKLSAKVGGLSTSHFYLITLTGVL